jgi:hypothetical protein
MIRDYGIVKRQGQPEGCKASPSLFPGSPSYDVISPSCTGFYCHDVLTRAGTMLLGLSALKIMN